MIFPLLLIGAGAATVIVLALQDDDGPVPDHPPDLPPGAPAPAGFPHSTHYKRVDAILPELARACEMFGVPLGVGVGWIAKESGGKLAEAPKPLKGERDSERGYFQQTPSESDKLNLDHAKLSTDSEYSILGGLHAIRELYMPAADKLGVAQKGTTYYWDLVKLVHTMGPGATAKIVALAKEADQARNWDDLEHYALEHDREIFSAVKHSPKKWFPLVDEVREVGEPFGFGQPTTVVGGAPAFTDIPDPIDALPKI